MQQVNQMLPSYPTSFIGRQDDIATICKLLDNKSCRLLTLLGSGGIGKTRLVVESVSYLQSNYLDGVLFVDLSTIQSSNAIIPTIASAANLSLDRHNKSSHDSFSVLHTYFQDKQLLLILDNFEHVVDGANYITELIHSAPDIQIIATSRKILNLQAEWVFNVQGLPYATKDDDKNLANKHAVKLFVERARQYQHDFSFDVEKENVFQICRLVEGLPLAIELAATWLKTIPCVTIVDEIQSGLDLLETNMPDIPKRHQSIRAIFDKTWQQLQDDEQLTLARLSVFIGDFTHHAAREIANTNLSTISNLSDHSLIQTTVTGRLRLHELLRQYAYDKLKSLKIVDDTNAAHARYYLKLLSEHQTEIFCGISEQFMVDLDNIHKAWTWGVTHGYYDDLRQAMLSLFILHRHQGSLTELIPILHMMLLHLDKDNLEGNRGILYAYMQAFWCTAYFLTGQHDELPHARQTFLHSIDRLKQLVAPDEKAIASYYYLCSAYIVGDNRSSLYEEFMEILTEFRQLNISHFILETLTSIAFLIIGYNRSDQFDEVEAYLKEAISLSKTLGDSRYGANALHELGHLRSAQGSYELATQALHESLAIRTDMRNRFGMIQDMSWLGHVAAAKGEYAQAERAYQDMINLAQEVNHLPLLGWGLHDLGRLAYLQKDYVKAIKYYLRSTDLEHSLLHKLSLIAGITSALAFTNPDQTAVQYLSMVLSDTSLLPLSRQMGKEAIQHLKNILPPNAYEQAWQQGKSLTIDREFSTVIALASEVEAHQSATSPTSITQHINQQLTEPLTERELEILNLVAEGYSNKEMCNHLVLSN